MQGALARALEATERALELCSRLPESASNAARAIDVRLAIYAPLLMRGDFARILLLIGEAEALARGTGDRLRLGRVLWRLSGPRYVRGEYAAALELARAAHAIGCDLGDLESRLSGALQAGMVHFQRGDYRAAIDMLKTITDGPDAEAAKRSYSRPAPPFIWAIWWLMPALGEIGEFDEALRYGDLAMAAVADGAPTSQVPTHMVRALVLATRGDVGAARAAIDESRQITWRRPSRCIATWA